MPNPVGRPSGYTPEIIEKTKAYLAQAKDDYIDDKRLKVNLPSVAGLSVYLEVSRSMIYRWAEDHQEFRDILEKILGEQESRLINKGLSGEYNSNIAKLALGKHGYKEQTDITSDNKPIPILGNVRKNDGNTEDNQPARED